MRKDYSHETGYESLLSDFKRYSKQTPKGVTLVKKGQNIYLQFKTTNKKRDQYACGCSFTLDGMVEALGKAHKVADKLKESSSETEFWQWYDSIIKESVSLKDDQLTFAQAIALVEEDFWSRPSRTKRKRDKENPSDINSWRETYGKFYEKLPLNKILDSKGTRQVIEEYAKGTRTYKYVVYAMKKLARMNKRTDIVESLEEINVSQTEYRILQTADLESFLRWKDRTLGVTATLHPNADLDSRRAWLWAFSIQIVYALRIAEVFAIKNLDKPYVTKDGVTIPALSDPENQENLIYIGEETVIGTAVKTGERLSCPQIPPKYPDLIERLGIKTPLLPPGRPRSNKPETLVKFYSKEARTRLVRWDAPFTQTHADRHLGNINGMQAGIPLEVRAIALRIMVRTFLEWE